MIHDDSTRWHQLLCSHQFPTNVESVGHAVALDGKGERDYFVIEHRHCIHCGFVQQRWAPDLTMIIPQTEVQDEELEG